MNSSINTLLRERENLRIKKQETEKQLAEAERLVTQLGARIVRLTDELAEMDQGITTLEQQQ